MAEDGNNEQAHAGDKAHGRIEQAADKIQEKSDRVEARVEQATDVGARAAHRAADKAADWQQRAEDMYDCARGFVRDKPVESMAIALAAGCVIGWLLRPRH